MFATGEIVDKRVGREDVTRALRADGLATTIGGVLNSFPYTCFAENVGLVRLTQVKSRWVVVAAGAFMILLGLVPKAGAVVAGIPHPVLGGAALAMFATVAVVGIQTLARVDFHDHRNVVIVGSSVGLAMLVTAQPDVATAVPGWAQIVFGSGITLGSLTAIVLNVSFHHVGRSRGPAVAGAPGAGAVRLEQVNRMSREEFVATFGRLFQGSSQIVGRAYDRRPFADTGEPARRVPGGTVLRASRGAACTDGRLSRPRRQPGGRRRGGRGVGPRPGQRRPHPARRRGPRRVRGPTAAYRERFGFPLIVCVRDSGSRERVLPRDSSGWQLAGAGARGRADRDREGGQPPLRRPRRRDCPPDDPRRVQALPAADAEHALLASCSAPAGRPRRSPTRPTGELAWASRWGANQYGKAENRVVRIYRETARHEIRDVTVSTSLRGDFAAAHLDGDQSGVLPTDTQKNTAYAFAKETGCARSRSTRSRWPGTSSTTSNR